MSQADGSVDVETLWASRVAEDVYRLDNTPFYAYGVSWQDEVRAPYDDDEGFATFSEGVRKSGNRTIRIMFEPPVQSGNSSDAVLNALKNLGCSYEGANASYVTISIPPGADFQRVRECLVEAGSDFVRAPD